MNYTYLDSVTYQSSAEDIGCGKMSWGSSWVGTFYPRLPCKLDGDKMTIKEAERIVGLNNLAHVQSSPSYIPKRPQGWVFSPLEIQKWTWPSQ